MFIAMPLIFVLGIFAIALEDKIRINKAAIALLMSVSMWMMLVYGAPHILSERNNQAFRAYIDRHSLSDKPLQEQMNAYLLEGSFIPHLGDVAQTLFFVMCSLLIVNIVDKHGGFSAISAALKTNKKRRLLWYISFASFFFSALLDNLAAAIVLIAILRKLVINPTDRMKYACMIVLAANAGGSWSPIGDVTTLLLWTGGNISALHQITSLFLPAFVNMLVPLIIAHFWLFKKNSVLRQSTTLTDDDYYIEQIPRRSRIVIFWIGILSLALVPVFQTLTHLPAFMCVLLGLVLLWIYTDLMYGHLPEMKNGEKLRIPLLSRSVDLPTIFFFLGILMSVAALNVGGQLQWLANLLSANISQPYYISILIGLFSSLVDNVALVAASMGMYPVVELSAASNAYLQHFVADGGFWTLLAYSAVTGGSIFIIGSATGVAVMGLEKISFGYFFKRFTPLALIGYISGILAFMAMT